MVRNRPSQSLEYKGILSNGGISQQPESITKIHGPRNPFLWGLAVSSLSFCTSVSISPGRQDCFYIHLEKVKMLAAQSCLILSDSMDCSPLGASVHKILQSRILEWLAILFSRGPSQPRDRTHVSHVAGGFFTV